MVAYQTSNNQRSELHSLLLDGYSTLIDSIDYWSGCSSVSNHTGHIDIVELTTIVSYRTTIHQVCQILAV